MKVLRSEKYLREFHDIVQNRKVVEKILKVERILEDEPWDEIFKKLNPPPRKYDLDGSYVINLVVMGKDWRIRMCRVSNPTYNPGHKEKDRWADDKWALELKHVLIHEKYNRLAKTPVCEEEVQKKLTIVITENQLGMIKRFVDNKNNLN